jgi:hypothetical protein
MISDPHPTPKRIAIVQSNYIPWKGYFDLINRVDEFILYDDVQYTSNDWRNRNQIKTQNGTIWLTLPTGKHNSLRVRDVEIADVSGALARHWRTLSQSYAKAPHFKRYKDQLEALFLGTTLSNLSQLNRVFLTTLCELLHIRTPLKWSWEYELGEGKTERLVRLCQQAHATEYISGPLAKDYIVPERFVEAGITLTYMDYSGYPEYPQLFPPFVHGVSVLDLLLNIGEEAGRYMKSFPNSIHRF